jgi:RNA polymerase sigma-70 factor (ECF subfamily)
MTPTSFKCDPSVDSHNASASWDWDDARRQCLREARRVLRSSAEVEDAAQEALVRVWRSRRTPKEVERPVAWLRCIARNEALRLRARECRRGEDLVAPDALEDHTACDGPDGGLRERLELVDLIATLPPADRELVWLRYVEDFTQARIATGLGVPEGTVKVRLHRVRGRLRRAREMRSGA